MRRILIYSILLLLTLKVSAQGIGIETGLNLSKLKVTVDGEDPLKNGDTKLFPRFRFGINYDFPVTENFYINAGVNYAPKGLKYSENVSGTESGILYSESSENEISLDYIEIPIYGKFIMGNNEMKLFGKFGPYISYAVSGKSYYNYSITFPDYPQYNQSSSDTDKDIIGTDKDKNFIKPLDFGFGFGVGINYKNLECSITYSLGLSNIDIQDNEEIKNRVFQIGLGYRFNN